jgi:hypothetical protein
MNVTPQSPCASQFIDYRRFRYSSILAAETPTAVTAARSCVSVQPNFTHQYVTSQSSLRLILVPSGGARLVGSSGMLSYLHPARSLLSFSLASAARNECERCSSGFGQVVTRADVTQGDKLIERCPASGAILKSVYIVRLLESPNTVSQARFQAIPEKA